MKLHRENKRKEAGGVTLGAHKKWRDVEEREQQKRRKGGGSRWEHTEKVLWLQRTTKRKEERMGVRRPLQLL